MLKISQRIPSRIQNIPFNIQPEGDEQINDERGAHGNEADVNEIFADGGGGDAHAFADGGAYAEDMPFYKLLKPIHELKVITNYELQIMNVVKSGKGIN